MGVLVPCLYVNIFRYHLKPLFPFETKTPWCWQILQKLTRLSMVDWHNTRFGRFVARVCLHSRNETPELFGEALIKSRLCPINAKVPVPWALLQVCILLEDGAGDSDLRPLVVKSLRFVLPVLTCLRT